MRGRSLLAPLPEREAYSETDNTTDSTRKLFVRSGQARGLGAGAPTVHLSEEQRERLRAIGYVPP